jgi:hypothetical protein
MQQVVQHGDRQSRQGALEQPFLQAPDALFAQCHRQRPAGRHCILDPLQGPDVLGQGVVHQNLGLALRLQSIEHPLHPHGLAAQHRLGQLEDVVTGHVEHGALDLGKAQFALRVQQRELLDLLVRRQQIALDPVGEKLQRALALLAGHDPLALLLQALGDPLRQGAALDRLDLQRDADAVQRREPGPDPGHLVQARQQHQRQRRIVALGRGGQLLQRRSAFLAGLARRNADFDDLFVGEQTQTAAGGQHLAPIEVRAGHRVDRAFGIALGPCGDADRVGSLLH